MPVAVPARTAAAAARPFVSAEDFDVTGMLTGVDPCESRYWWMPELYGPDAAADHVPADLGQATRRTPSRTTAAA